MTGLSMRVPRVSLRPCSSKKDSSRGTVEPVLSSIPACGVSPRARAGCRKKMDRRSISRHPGKVVFISASSLSFLKSYQHIADSQALAGCFEGVLRTGQGKYTGELFFNSLTVRSALNALAPEASDSSSIIESRSSGEEAWTIE